MCVAIAIGLLAGTQEGHAKPGEHDPDFEVAHGWLSAFKVDDAASVENSTALPFTFATTRRKKKCEGTVKTASALTEWLKCAHKADDRLVSDLHHAEVGTGGTDSPAMKTLLKKVSKPGTWVRAFLHGDGVTFAFRFLVVKSNDGARRIGAFLLDTTPRRNEDP
jgi:hypothetical protein